MIRRKKIESKPKPEKAKTVGGGEIGSGYTPGQDGGSWLLPDSAKESMARILSAFRDSKPPTTTERENGH